MLSVKKFNAIKREDVEALFLSSIFFKTTAFSVAVFAFLVASNLMMVA